MKSEDTMYEYLRKKIGEEDYKLFLETEKEFVVNLSDTIDINSPDEILDEYISQYNSAIYNLWNHNPIDDVIIPLLLLINTYIELVLKQFILKTYNLELTSFELNIAHHNLEKLVNHEGVKEYIYFKLLTETQYDILKKM